MVPINYRAFFGKAWPRWLGGRFLQGVEPVVLGIGEPTQGDRVRQTDRTLSELQRQTVMECVLYFLFCFSVFPLIYRGLSIYLFFNSPFLFYSFLEESTSTFLQMAPCCWYTGEIPLSKKKSSDISIMCSCARTH